MRKPSILHNTGEIAPNRPVSSWTSTFSIDMGETSILFAQTLKRVAPPLKNAFKPKYLGPVVQSVVSLTSSLRVILLNVLADSIYNILIFFAEKSYSHFFSKKFQHICVSHCDFFTCASRVPYSHFCFGTHILNLSESQDSQSYSRKFCNGRNNFLVGLTLYSPSKSWDT